MSLSETLAEDRRLVILRTLAEAPGNRLNEQVLRTALDAFGHRVTRDALRGDVTWLAEAMLVEQATITAPSGAIWMVQLRQAGQDVAEGRTFPGVAKPALR